MVIFFIRIYTEVWKERCLQNFCNDIPDYTVSEPRRPQSKSSLAQNFIRMCHIFNMTFVMVALLKTSLFLIRDIPPQLLSLNLLRLLEDDTEAGTC